MLTKNKKQLLVFPLFALGFIAMPMSLHAEEQDSIQTNPIEQVVIRSYVPQRPTAPSIGQPAALTWITSRDLSQYRMQSITDLTGRVPSLFVPDYGSKRSAAIYLRGSGARSSGQTIGLYVDGVPVLNKSGFNFDIPGITGVEVLRGPQGTLYGRNAMSGIINYYTRSAFDQPGGEAKLTAGSHRLLRGSVEQAFRLSDKVGLSYGLSGTTRRGYFYNETRQAYQDSLRMVGGFAKLEYRPTEQLEMALSLSGDYVQQGGFPYRTDDPRTKQPLPLSADAPESYKRHTATLRYLLSYKWGGVQLQSATSYQYLFDETQMDMDALPLSYFHVTQGLREHGLTQEFILKNLRGERPSRYDWSVGLFGYHDAKRVEAPVTFSYGGLSALINQAMAALKQRVPAMPSLAYYDGNVYIGGSFTHLSGGGRSKVYARNAGRVDLSSRPDRSWNPEINGSVQAVGVSEANSSFYAGGHFTKAHGTERAWYAAKFSTQPGAAQDTSFVFEPSTTTAGKYQQTIATAGNRVYIGGSEHSLFGYDAGSNKRVSGSVTFSRGGDLQASTVSSKGIIYASCHCSDAS